MRSRQSITFPRFKFAAILDQMWSLLTYRNLPIDMSLPSSLLISLHNKLVDDARGGKLNITAAALARNMQNATVPRQGGWATPRPMRRT